MERDLTMGDKIKFLEKKTELTDRQSSEIIEVMMRSGEASKKIGLDKPEKGMDFETYRKAYMAWKETYEQLKPYVSPAIMETIKLLDEYGDPDNERNDQDVFMTYHAEKNVYWRNVQTFIDFGLTGDGIADDAIHEFARKEYQEHEANKGIEQLKQKEAEKKALEDYKRADEEKKQKELEEKEKMRQLEAEYRRQRLEIERKRQEEEEKRQAEIKRQKAEERKRKAEERKQKEKEEEERRKIEDEQDRIKEEAENKKNRKSSLIFWGIWLVTAIVLFCIVEEWWAYVLVVLGLIVAAVIKWFVWLLK